jgi:hypothetical protein
MSGVCGLGFALLGLAGLAGEVVDRGNSAAQHGLIHVAVAEEDVVEVAELLILIAVGAEEICAFVGVEVGRFGVEVEERINLLARAGE